LTVIPTRNGIKSFFICGDAARSTKEAKPFFDVCAYVAFVAHVVVNAVDDRRPRGIAHVAFFTVVLPTTGVAANVADDLARRFVAVVALVATAPLQHVIVIMMMIRGNTRAYQSLSRVSRIDESIAKFIPRRRVRAFVVRTRRVGVCRSVRCRVG
jgi:hypothetical protein